METCDIIIQADWPEPVIHHGYHTKMLLLETCGLQHICTSGGYWNVVISYCQSIFRSPFDSVKLLKNQAKGVNPFKKSTLLNLKWFQKLILCPKVRRKPIRRRLKSYGGTGEKAESRQRRDEQYILKRPSAQHSGIRWGFEATFKILAFLALTSY